jgi:alcohol dehydrogenase, propanol-preferring
VRALQLTAWQAEPELRDVDVPTPGPGQVLVKVEGAGLCHSDLEIMDWPAGTQPWELPFTLGHETAGRVAALGSGASGFSEGDPVLVFAMWGCGSCRFCVTGAENLCTRRLDHSAGGGMGRDGGLAEYLLVPSSLFRLRACSSGSTGSTPPARRRSPMRRSPRITLFGSDFRFGPARASS